MNEKDFCKYLDEHASEFEYAHGELVGKEGIFVRNKKFDTELHFTYETVQNRELQDLLTATHCGRNVDQITRVTGFFSKVSGWNKGKRAELNDRSRSDVTKGL